MHQHALLLRTPVIIFGLHFQKVQAGVHITADTELLAVGMTGFVGGVHRIVVGIEIERIIRCDTLAVDLLDVIVVLGHCEQLLKLWQGGYKLGVCTVHQPYGTHLFEGNGVEMIQ